MNNTKQQRTDPFWIWYFGIKVLLAIGFIHVVALLPILALGWIACVLMGADNLDGTGMVGLLVLLAGLAWYPFAFGWMVHHAPDWFVLRWGAQREAMYR